ncbi:uncharacterized protein LOC107305264 [Oryza brachyantha]|uniref:Uncharacterized protein n=1 Tax=Oryza brachyantha TaxID=4533 RepID=J3N6F2_ORYBR|nr:uncharacterized protein LOC107305264 [Oryza brachyantha]
MSSAAYVLVTADDHSDDELEAVESVERPADAAGPEVQPDPPAVTKEEETTSGDADEAGAFFVLWWLSALCVVLGLWALCRASSPASPSAIVWTLSSVVCGALAGWVGVFSGVGALAAIFRVTYVALVAYTVDSHLSATAGLIVIFSNAVATAAFFGYYLAVYQRGDTNTPPPPPPPERSSSPVQGDELV